MQLFMPAPWSTYTHMRERPVREVAWDRALRNGDIQVIYEPDTIPEEVTGHFQNYYMAMYNEGEWHPMAQVACDFDVYRRIAGFERIEQETYVPPDPCCGLFRDEAIDQRPLYQQGYCSAFLPYEQFVQALHWGGQTHEWDQGRGDAGTDKMLQEGRVYTGKYDYTYESIERVQYLL